MLSDRWTAQSVYANPELISLLIISDSNNRGYDQQQSLFLSIVATAELLRQLARRSLLAE